MKNNSLWVCLFVCLCQGQKSKVKKVVGKNELGECVWVKAGGCGWKWVGDGWTWVQVGENNLGVWVWVGENDLR